MLIARSLNAGLASASTPASLRRPGTLTRDAWIVGAMLAALLLRMIRLDHAPLWYDETFTAQWVALPWNEMLPVILADNHLPLYFVLIKAWTALVGSSTWLLRLPGVIFSVAAVGFVAALADTLATRRAARWAAVLAALSPYLLHHAQEARMYPLLAMLAAVSLLLLARYLTGQSERLGTGFVLVSAALLATHYYAEFLLAAEVAVLLWLRPRPWRTWLFAVAAACVLAVGPVLAAAFMARHDAGHQYDMGMLALPGLGWAMLAGYELLPSSADLHAQGWRAAVSYLPPALLATAAVLILAQAGLRRFTREGRVLILVVLAAVTLGPFSMSLLFHIGINPRYTGAGVPALLVLLAAGAPVSRRTRLRAAALAVVAVIMAVASVRHLAEPGHGREDIRAAAAWLDRHVPPQEQIFVTSREMADLARFHWPQRNFHDYPAPKTVVRAGDGPRYADEFPFGNGNRAIYVIGRDWVSDPNQSLQRALTERYAQCPGADFRGIRILCLKRPGTAQSPKGTS